MGLMFAEREQIRFPPPLSGITPQDWTVLKRDPIVQRAWGPGGITIDGSVLEPGAAISNLEPGDIDETLIADDAVTTDKIAPGAVTNTEVTGPIDEAKVGTGYNFSRLGGSASSGQMSTNAAAAVNAGATSINANRLGTGYNGANLSGDIQPGVMQTNVVNAISGAGGIGASLVSSGDLAQARMQANAAGAINAGSVDVDAAKVGAGYLMSEVSGNLPNSRITWTIGGTLAENPTGRIDIGGGQYIRVHGP